MSLRNLLKTILPILIITGFVALGVGQVQTDRELKLENTIELKSRESQLIELNNKYEDVLQKKTDTQKERDEQSKQIEELESERERLQRELQAKRAREAQEEENARRTALVQSQRVSASPMPAGGGDCEQYRHLVAQYSWNTDTMMRAMRLESSCNTNAVGDQYTIRGVYAPSCGLLQVRTLPGRPSCEQLKDPAFNIATAYKIWQGQGYRAWTVLH